MGGGQMTPLLSSSSLLPFAVVAVRLKTQRRMKKNPPLSVTVFVRDSVFAPLLPLSHSPLQSVSLSLHAFWILT